MATNAANARDSRRRKIVDRGADRLALISGRIQSLPPQSPSDASLVGPSQPSDPTVSPATENGTPGSMPTRNRPSRTAPPLAAATRGPLIGESMTDNDAKEDHLSNGNRNVLLVSHLPRAEDNGDRMMEVSCNVQPASCLPRAKDSADRVREVGHNVQPASRLPRAENFGDHMTEVSRNVQTASRSSREEYSADPSTAGMDPFLELRTLMNQILTTKRITYAIAATERDRLFCSLAMAVLVVLSHWGFPLLGSSIIKGVVSFRPLFLVLLTNVTLVVWWIILDFQRGIERSVRREYRGSSSGGYNWAEQAGIAVEIGLVMQKAIDAMFMDSSVYVVIVICGLSVFR